MAIWKISHAFSCLRFRSVSSQIREPVEGFCHCIIEDTKCGHPVVDKYEKSATVTDIVDDLVLFEAKLGAIPLASGPEP